MHHSASTNTHSHKNKESSFKLKTLFIMRGLPGSGKSSIAESLVGGSGRQVSHTVEAEGVKWGAETYRFKMCKHGVVCTTDAYFYSEWDSEGRYNFDPKKIGMNHQLNQGAVSFAMSKGIPGIVVDNTNTQTWEMGAYIKLAEHYGYKVVIVGVPHVSIDLCSERNSHDVPREVLERMESNLCNNPFPFDMGTDGEKL